MDAKTAPSIGGNSGHNAARAPDLARMTRRELRAHARKLRIENLGLRRENETLREQIRRLRAEVTELRRASKRQAAPFSRGTHKRNPRAPGRKPGQGAHDWRQPPKPESVSETVEVPCDDTRCSHCGGDLADDGVDDVYETDMPPMPQPTVRHFRMHRRRCKRCGRYARAKHPDVAPNQYGATAHRVGPNVKALAQLLHYEMGVPVRKVPQILKLTTGVSITQGAITRDAERQVERKQGQLGPIGERYEELRKAIKTRPITYTDDTGWKVGGDPAYLMVFDTDQETVFQIRPQHRHQEVQEIVPASYRGVLATDRGSSYADKSYQNVPQQKCIFHLLRSIDEALDGVHGRAGVFGTRLARMLRAAMSLWGEYHKGRIDRATFDARADALSMQIGWHLRERRLTATAMQALLHRVRALHDRDALLRFLRDPTIEPTTTRVEREVRSAVAARKVSHCSKTLRGARTRDAWTSVLRTEHKRAGHAAPATIAALIRGPPVRPA